MKKILLLFALLALCATIDSNAQSRSFKRDTLVKITSAQKSKVVSANTKRGNYKGDSLIQLIPRYQGEASVGLVFVPGVGMGWGIHTTHGRRTSDLFYTGFGFGVDLYYERPENYSYSIVKNFFSIYYNARWYLLRDKPVQLMLNLNAGLGIGSTLGILPFTAHLSAGVGASYKVSPRSAVNAMLSYDYKLTRIGGGLSLRFGFQF